MAARKTDVFGVSEDEIDVELRFVAGAEPGTLQIEVRHQGESLGFVQFDRELTREARLAIGRVEDLAKPAAKETAK